MSSLTVTAIVPAFGRPQQLEKLVRSLIEQDLDPSQYEVIVVDSSPSDENQRIVEALAESARCCVRCLRKKPEGPGPSRNLGAQHARGRILAFIDSDCFADPGWLRAGVAAFEPRVGLVQGRTIPEPGVPHGALSTYVWVESESHLYEAANIFYDRAAFAQGGGFPADMHPRRDKPVGGEDVELAWNVKRAGWRSKFADQALVMHVVEPLSLTRWLYNKRLYIFPRLARSHPELRRFFFARYFFEPSHALLTLMLLGIGLAMLWPLALLLALPYVLLRLFEPTNTFRGLRRPVRVAAHFARDSVSLLVLLAGSVRYRSLLL